MAISLETVCYALSFAVLIPLLLYTLYSSHTNTKIYPPSPKGYPIIGNLFDPSTNCEHQWETYKQIADELGMFSNLTDVPFD
jgi:hypothetical protein